MSDRPENAVREVDTHAHIFEEGLELAPVRRYAPTYDATAEDYLKVLDENGVYYGVLLQPSFLGFNNDYMMKALRKYRDRLRGIAVVEPTIDPAELDAMDRDGVVGVRLNLQGLPIPDFGKGAWPEFLGHMRRLDWQVEVHRESRDLPYLIEPLLDSGVALVIDHFGRPDNDAGTGDYGFQYLLTKGRTRRIWVKLSGWYRNWNDHLDISVATDCAAMLLDAYGPERLIWGSDWPNTQNESKITFAMARENIEKWVPDEKARKTILQDTPIRLFRFHHPEGR